jgi:hypothetical protein
VGAADGATLCDLGVFVDQAAEPIPAQDAHACHFRGRVHTSGGQVLLQRSVRPVDVAVIGILAQDVGEPAAEAVDPARTGCEQG